MEIQFDLQRQFSARAVLQRRPRAGRSSLEEPRPSAVSEYWEPGLDLLHRHHRVYLCSQCSSSCPLPPSSVRPLQRLGLVPDGLDGNLRRRLQLEVTTDLLWALLSFALVLPLGTVLDEPIRWAVAAACGAEVVLI